LGRECFITGLAARLAFSNVHGVIGFLRFIGILIAAIWVGAAVFLALGVEPALFSHDTQRYLDRSYGYLSGVLVALIRTRFLYFSLGCGGLALVHLVAEWLSVGRPLRGLTFWLAMALVALALLNCAWMQSHLTSLHETRYRAATPALRQAAQGSLEKWRTASQVADWLMLGGLLLYLWRIASQPDASRFVGPLKFPGGYRNQNP
jgi:hypothetical protein